MFNHIRPESAGEMLKHYGAVILALRIIPLQLDLQLELPKLTTETRYTDLVG